MLFNYPPLMAAVIDAVPESERAVAVGSFTAFEIGSVAGGLILGTVAEFYGKRGGFAVAAVIAIGGLVMLWRMLPGERFSDYGAELARRRARPAFLLWPLYGGFDLVTVPELSS